MKWPLEIFWAEVLSRDPVRVVAGWETLDGDEQDAVWAHLARMATEPDWTDGQRQSAQAALIALQDSGITR
ncbi:MAG: hypothetical protein JW910_12235 [Anaerolineae bacterium]|nr:hypothetical protein [Anaerolineae bacterium]